MEAPRAKAEDFAKYVGMVGEPMVAATPFERDTLRRFAQAIMDDDPLAPDAPTNLVATASPSVMGGNDLTWLAPANDNGAAVTDYEYRVSTDGSLDTEPWLPTGSGRTTATNDPSCGAGVTCRYQVRAINAAGAALAVSDVPEVSFEICSEISESLLLPFLALMPTTRPAAPSSRAMHPMITAVRGFMAWEPIRSRG